jgi:hypothetical protein
MGFFSRAPRRDPEHAPRDPAFPYLSEDEGALLRREVRAALAEKGLEATLSADLAVDASGRRYGLGNLAAVCHNDARGQAAWPGLIREHMARVLRLMDGPSVVDTLPVAELRRRLLPRVMPLDSIPDARGFGRAVPLAPGLVRVLALSLPESAVALKDSLVERVAERLGESPDDLTAVAEANMASTPVEQHEVMGRGEGIRIDVLSGASIFTASRVLQLDTLARSLTGRELGPDGALVALPFSRLLAFHAIRDARMVESLNGLARVAAVRHADSPGPVSPHVYWWRDGRLSQVTEVTGTQIRVVVGSELQRLLERLVAEK